MPDVAADPLRANGHTVELVRSFVRSGMDGLGHLPSALKRLLAEQAWRDRIIIDTGERATFERFEDFVTARPLKGLDTTVTTIKNMIRDDPEALDLLDRACQARHGGDRKKEASKFDNINVARPTGTSSAHALRRLRTQAPELHQRVIAGELSPHAAMVQAGFRPRTITVRVDDMERLAAALMRALPSDALTLLRRLLGP